MPARPDVRPRDVVGLTAALLAYQHALNHVPFPDPAYVPTNLALAGAVVAFARSRWNLDRDTLGLSAECIRPGVAWGAGAFAAMGGVMLAALALPAAQPFLADVRAAGLQGWSLASYALVRIPFGTAIPEEVLFRGVLLGALATRVRWWPAALTSSALFGLWHVAPTQVALEMNEVDLGWLGNTAAVTAAVAATAAAGIGFCLLRRSGRGLLAPVLAHCATNAIGLVAAVIAQRNGGA